MLGVALAVVAPAPAQAAVHEIKARDSLLDWDPPRVVVASGDTVRWSFDGTQQAHNVQPADGATWMAASPIGVPAPPWEHTFETEGDYNFVCQVHPTTMRGTVTVAKPGEPTPVPTPAPPPPLSAQPFVNDAAVPPVPETVRLDETAPRLSRVAAKRSGRRARVRVRVSEQSVVSVRFKRGRRTVRTVETAADGLRGVTVRMRRGRYRVEVRAIDLAGNRSRMRVVRVTVR